MYEITAAEDIFTLDGTLRASKGEVVDTITTGTDGIEMCIRDSYVTGIMCAINDRKLSSAVGFRGICRKVLIFLLVGVAHIVDLHVVGSGSALRGAVACFYLSNEGVSMLENAAHLGLPIPEKLKVILEQLHDRESPATPDDTTDNTNDGQ